MIVASAPAKLVLCGEYVVLDGAPAIGVALNARATASIAAVPGVRHLLASPGYAKGLFPFRMTQDGKINWDKANDTNSLRPDFSLFESIWSIVASTAGNARDRSGSPTAALSPAARDAGSGNVGGAFPDACEFTLDTSSFIDRSTGTKLGLGSSAALAVALSAALAEMCDKTIDLAGVIELHRQFQNGRGSGIDVAVSWHGGVISYRMEGSVAETLSWPNGLHYAVLWSGAASKTTDKIDIFAASRSANQFRTRLAQASTTLVEEWERSDAAEIQRSLADYTQLLRAFDAALGLGIFEAGHDAMHELAALKGVVYKPCGAGGGDVGIAISTNATSLHEFTGAAADIGFHALDLDIDDQGMTLHT